MRSRYRVLRGSILIEVMLSSMMAIIVGLGMIALLTTDISSWSVINGQNLNDATARQPMDMIADHVRNAQPYGTVTSQVLNAATATSISPYTDTAGAYTKFWLDTSVTPHVLKQTTGAKTVSLVTGVASLQFTYYVSGSNYSPASASWTTTADSHNPTNVELPNVAAVGISATTTVNGYSRSVNTLVRMRNSPTNPPAYG